jgi:proteasome activator-like protein
MTDNPEPQSQQQGELIQHPAKLLRITAMVRGLLDEVRQAPLDDSGRKRMREIYESSLAELKDALSENLQKELETLTIPLERTPSESEIRVAQAQLVGWLEGLLHGIKAAMWAQQMEAQAQLEELQRRGLPGGPSAPSSEAPGDPPPHGQYL